MGWSHCFWVKLHWTFTTCLSKPVVWVKGIWYLQKCIEWQHCDVFHGRHFKFKRKFNIVCNYYFHFLYPRLSTFHQQHCFVQSTLLSVISSRWQTKRSLTFNTKKHFSVHGSDFKSFPVLFDCMFVIASGMFGCLLAAVGCAFGDDKDPEESNEEPRVWWAWICMDENSMLSIFNRENRLLLLVVFCFLFLFFCCCCLCCI